MSNKDKDLTEESIYIWVVRYDDGRRKDRLIVGDSDDITDHAPAVPNSSTGEVEYLGTFAKFAKNRDSIEVDLRKTTGFLGSITAAVGRVRFWKVIRGDNN